MSSAHQQQMRKGMNAEENLAVDTTVDSSFTKVVDKRARKQQEKEQKKLQGSIFAAPKAKGSAQASGECSNNDSLTQEDASHSYDTSAALPLSKKKQQYLEDPIKDKQGEFEYDPDNPDQYKKARKRKQNRESAVRSREKKREEMQKLELQVAELQKQKAEVEQQKAAIESANEELQRQNKYWEDLFAKQQLQRMTPTPVRLDSNVANAGTSSDFTRSDHSDGGADSFEASYADLKMAREQMGNKRQRRQDSNNFRVYDLSHELQIDREVNEENTFDHYNNQTDELKRVQSIEFERNNYQSVIDPNEVFLERPANQQQRGSPFFLGLALVFGAVGAVTQISAGSAAESNFETSGAVKINTQAGLKGGEVKKMPDTLGMKFGEEDDLVQFEVDPSSTSQNFYTALHLLMQAFRTIPEFTYVSFALSLVFLVIYLNPWNYLFSSSSLKEPTLSASRSRTQQSEATKGMRTTAKPSAVGKQSRQKGKSQKRTK